MQKRFYAYVTGRNGGLRGFNYNAFGIIAFREESHARTELREILKSNHGLEGSIVNLTPLVENGFILEAGLYFKD